jgi:DNA-binding transcriptional regulator YdaS (Cro superfamily)
MLMSIEDITKEELLALVKIAITEAVEVHPLSPEEVHWVRLAIKAEVERAELRKAIIEKTLTGLVWAMLCGVGVYFIDWFSAHWISNK